MNKELFIERYKRLFTEDEQIQLSLHTILSFEQFIGKDIEDTSVSDIQQFMDYLIDTKANRYNNVIHIARYYYYADMKEHYIHMTKYFNSLGVLEHIIDRIQLYEPNSIKDNIFTEFELPPFGTSSTDLPSHTKRFMDILYKHISKESCNQILAGNNHQIPASSFDEEKKFYEQASTFAEYLKDRHERKVAELQSYYDKNQIWFEQIITEDVIDFVRNNPEVLSGVIENDKLYITKIPYDINNFLTAENDILKRYYACHCSFVRENIKDQKEDIPREWCYCSGGYAKFPFETILGQNLNITLLTTPLDGNNLCRFEVDLNDIEYKK